MEKQISDILGVGPGVTALIGGGGKTTLMYTLTEELRRRGTVILCTSTRIRPPERYPLITGADTGAVRRALSDHGAVCVGTPGEDGKLRASPISFTDLAALADYVIVEADGAHRLPLKAHAPHEPVIPENAQRTVLVMGIDGIGMPINEICHRPERYAPLAGAGPEDIVTPAIAARVVTAEGMGDIAYINKADDEARMALARSLAALLPIPAAAGSLHRGGYECLY